MRQAEASDPKSTGHPIPSRIRARYLPAANRSPRNRGLLGPRLVVTVGKQDNSMLGLDVTEGDRGRVMASLGATREGGGGT